MSDYNYLDKAGLTTLWSKIKSYISSLGYTTNKGTVGGSGTSGYLAKWTGTTAVGNGPQLGNSTVAYLRNDGNWAEPPGTITKIQRNGSDLTISNKTVNINVPTSASQLANDEKYVSAKQSEDNAPYIYRATGGSLKVGNREEVEAIVGGTVAWNQLCNSSSVTGTSGHKFYLKKGGAESITNTDTFTGLSNGTDMVIDLTLMLGSTLADYVYSLEQATAGAGVAWFRRYFPKDYYAYSAPTMAHVSASAHETTGFNQWNEEWEVGAINESTGQNSTDSSRIRSKDYTQVIPNATYYFEHPNPAKLFAYDADKNYIDQLTAWDNRKAVTIPTDCQFVRFAMGSAYGTTYNHDICINLSSPSRNGEYEEYVKHSYPLDNSLTLRGIPKLDASNNLYYDGDTYEWDGTVTRKYAEVIYDGTENWAIAANYNGSNYQHTFFRIQNVPNMKTYSAVADYVKNMRADWAEPLYVPDGTVDNHWTMRRASGSAAFYVLSPTSDGAVSLATFKAKLAATPLHVVYELATQTTESADPFTAVQTVEEGGTEEFVDYGVSQGTRDFAVPVGHETRYFTIPEIFQYLQNPSTLPIAHGGTGATTAAAARTALGLGSAAVAATAASVGNNTNLPTGAAIQTYVTGLGYEANQNAFTTVKVGTTDLVADSKTDTLTITAGNNITLTPIASSDSFSIAATNTTYSNATSSAAGLMSAADKQTLDGLVASGGEVNQNAFSNVVVGSSTVAADQKTDTLTLVGSGAVSISANTSTDTITITGTNTTYGAATTTTAGLMSASDKIKLNGVPTSVFKTIKVGTTNLIADNAEDTLTITAGDNITLTPTASSDSFSIAATNTTYAVATTAVAGLMSAADKIKIDKTIHQLSTLSTVSADDQIAIYDISNNITGKITLENVNEFIGKRKPITAGTQTAYGASATSVADSSQVFINIWEQGTNHEDVVNISIPFSTASSGLNHIVIQKAYNNWQSTEYVGGIPIADVDGFILDENVMDSTTIAAWEAIL